MRQVPNRLESPVSPTARRIMDVAEQLVQTRGFNAFSYADIAATLNLTKASLHYHFPTKADLGTRLILRHDMVFMAALSDISARHASANERLRRYVGRYQDVLQTGRLCLCGMLAAEAATLPEPMRAGLRDFFEHNEAWLETVLTEGREAGTLQFGVPAREMARLLTSALEGAMILARCLGAVDRFHSVANHLLADIDTT